MFSTVAATIPATNQLHYTHRPRGFKMVREVSQRLREVRKMSITTTPIRLRGSSPRWHQAPSTQHPTDYQRLKAKGTSKISLDEELPGHTISDTEEQEDVETEYHDQDQDQPDNEQLRYHRSTSHEEKTPTLREILETQAIDHLCTRQL